MELITHEIYNEETEKVEIINIWGFCPYCKDPVKEDEEYKEKKNKIYHQECWEQMKR